MPRVHRQRHHSQGARRNRHQYSVDFARAHDGQTGQTRESRRRDHLPAVLRKTELVEMSRIGKKPIALPKGVKVKIDDGQIEVSGPKGSLSTVVPEGVSFRMDGDNLVAERASDDKA